MKYSKLFGKTSKTIADDSNISTKYLTQAGFIRESVAGRYYLLPLGWRVMQKIMRIIKQEMDAIGSQEMLAPILHPLELWKETNRTNTTGFELMKVKDRRDAEFALGGTAEEMFVDLVRKYNVGYGELPFHLYQFSTKFRDEMRARGGLLRVREFIMKDSYSFDKDENEFKKMYSTYRDAYTRLFDQIGLKTVIVESDNGYIGGEYCHEFVVDADSGETSYLVTEDGSYAAHEEVATFQVEGKNTGEELKPLIEVDAKRGTTMEDGVKLHNMPLWQQIKDVLFVDEKGRFVLAIIRGDFDVNEVKLCHVADAITLRHATDDEIRNVLHSEPGFISPVGIKEKLEQSTSIVVVADKSLRTIRNAYGGANKLHRDMLNMNIDRDYKADIEGDIALAKAGYMSIDGKKLVARKGIEVGNIFQLGLHYTRLMKGAEYTNEKGEKVPYYMGCYGIGIGRTLATVVEKSNDAKGILWPDSVAPYRVHLAGLDLHDEEMAKKLESIYADLQKYFPDEVLYDNRVEARAGEKFADADLIGCPIRVVVSKRSGDKLEVKERKSKEAVLMSMEEFVGKYK